MHEQHTRCLLAEHRVIRLLTTLIDPSHRRKHSIDKHEGHASFENQMYHLTLEIESKVLKKMNRIEAQRLIMKVLKDDLKNRIHALEIRIK